MRIPFDFDEVGVEVRNQMGFSEVDLDLERASR